MKPFKRRLSYFHPRRHIPAVNWTHDLNISPVEGYTFSYCQSMQNIQMITDTGGCNKYCIKYVGKIDEQNYVVVYSDGSRNGSLITKRIFYTTLNWLLQNIMKIKLRTRNVKAHTLLVVQYLCLE